VRRRLLDDGYGETIFWLARQLAASCDERDLSRLQQLVELAYEYQPASTLRTSDFLRLVETRRIADPQAANVRVMTIHQAKGLEFDVVFLPELEHRLVGQPDRFVAGRPGPTEMVNVVCRLADKTVRQFFPPELEKLFVDDMCLEVSESLCVLYVAMTRAVHSLYMIVAPAKGNEKSMPKTFAGMLRATLAMGKGATGRAMLYEEGDREWFRTLHPEVVEKNLESDGTRSVPITIRLAPAAMKRERGLERTSPSALEGGTRLSANVVLKPRSDEAYGIGTLFHAWLAQIEWLDDGQPGDDVLRQIAAGLRGEIGSAGRNLEGHIARFRKQLAAPAVKEVLSRKSYPPGKDLTVWRERPFALRTENGILTGSMDRLVIVKSGGKIVAADVLDFKTDEIAAGDAAALAAKVDFYRPQVEAYREAAGKLLGIRETQVTGRLVFIGSNAVQSVT
jgi:ATP-dependent helicase/nuclease subunit A